MKYYLDTNAIYQLRHLPHNYKDDIYTSYLAVFELISGIDDEKSFRKRKSALKQLIDKNIQIIWESMKTLLVKAIGGSTIDCDVEATELMMGHVLECDSYEQLGKVSYRHGKELYDLSIFQQHDKRFSNETSDLFEQANKLISKEDRANLRMFKLDPSVVQTNMELSIMRILIDNGFEKHSEKYSTALERFYKQKNLHNYLKFIAIYQEENCRHGRTSGQNDGFDILHTIYSDPMDYFVSDDTIYRRIPNGFLKTSFITFNNFIGNVTA